MTKPTIHLNGTSGKSLADGYLEAWRAVEAAADAVAKNGPNPRDYYPAGPQAWEAARVEHCARLAALRAVAEELMELVMHCQA